MTAALVAAQAQRYAEEMRSKERTAVLVDDRIARVIEIYVESAFSGDPTVRDLGNILQGLHDRRPDIANEALFVGQDAAVRRLWQRHRIAYSVDPDLWRELGDTDMTAPVPHELFTRLPHPDPYVGLPEPMVFPTGDGGFQRIHGFFVTGRGDVPQELGGGTTQVSTAWPGVRALGLVFGGMVEDGQGRPRMLSSGVQDAIWTRVGLDPREGDGTVEAMVQAVLPRFHAADNTGRWTTYVPDMIRKAVTLLVYVCAVNADLVPLPRPRTGKASGRGSGQVKAPRVVTVGYRVGSALRAHAAREREAQGAAGTGRRMAPHVRRAHPHTYRTGVGRAERVVKWLPPIPINMDGDAPEPTVVRVPGR